MIQAVHHESYGIYAYPESRDTLNVRLRTAREDVTECYVYYIEKFDYTPDLICERMDRFLHDQYFDYFRASIRIKSKRFKYFFKIVDREGRVFFYLEDRFDKSFPRNSLDGRYFQYPYINDDEIIDMPPWAKDSIFYQIFPDRFCNGDSINSHEKFKCWGAEPTRDSFFGGNLKGIKGKLGYLRELGVNAIYITPVFLSDSNHKYDTVDYYTIDPDFGSKEDMKNLVKESHSNGIRVVLDAVFNHCSSRNRIFLDVIGKGKHSPYADWFYTEKFPVKTNPVPNYETFGVNISNMPRLNTSNPRVREYLLDVAEYWTRELDIDGWRLDVADEISHSFWKKFRKRLKAVKKDIFIIGEVWYRATPWLMGDEFDSVMNYPFRQAVIDFFVKRELDSSGFAERVYRYFLSYKDGVPYYLLNLLGSHDTARFLTLCNGDVEKMRLAVIFTMAFVGVPMVYYGDEIGIQGGDDPDCRKTMVWSDVKPVPEIFDLYKKLIKIRKDNRVLIDGGLEFIKLSENKKVLSFIRNDGNQKALVIINNSNLPVQVELDKTRLNNIEVFDCIHSRWYRFYADGKTVIELDRMDAAILI